MNIPYGPPAALGTEFVELSPDVIAAIMLTLLDGWSHAVAFPDVNASAGEVFVTERLRDGMRRALKTPGHAWGKTMVVLSGMESRSSPDVVVPDGRTDIPILLIHVFQRLGEHDPHAVVECKRIAGSNAHTCREYVIEGVDRFRSGKYGRHHSVGFMLGYLLSGTAGEAVVGINAHLGRVSRDAEYLEPTEPAANIVGWTSRHPRATSPSPIDLYHSFLDFASATS